MCFLDQVKTKILKMSFENITILLKEFEYSITLRGLLKEQFQVKNLNSEICFLIKTQEIMKLFRHFDVCVKNELDYVCTSTPSCRTHAAHEYLKYLVDEIINYVENEKRFYKAFYFRKTHSSDVAFGGWTAEPVQPICLKHLSYSRRLAYLN